MLGPNCTPTLKRVRERLPKVQQCDGGQACVLAPSLMPRSCADAQVGCCHAHGQMGRARAQVLSGQLVAPNVPTAAETLEMQRLVDTYGKTFHTWQARARVLKQTQ